MRPFLTPWGLQEEKCVYWKVSVGLKCVRMSRIPWLWNLLSQYWLEIETSFCFFPAPWGRQRSPQSKQICSFDDGDTHTRSIDLVGVESILSAIEVKDSQMKPEIPNASHATPHFWREMQMEPIKRDKSTSRDFVSRGRPLRGQTRLAPLAKRSTSSKSREYRETSELGNKKDKYAHPELLYEPSFESFRTLKL